MADAHPQGRLTAAPFALVGHDAGQTSNGTALVLAPLDPSLASALAAAFAAMDPWAAYPYPADALAAYLAGGNDAAPLFAVAAASTDSPGKVLGAVGLRLDWLRGPYIQFLGLLEEAQGSGIGGAVMAWIETQARRAGARNLWVAASDFNAGALRFYGRHGFTRIADLPGLVRDDRSEVLLRKRLLQQ